MVQTMKQNIDRDQARGGVQMDVKYVYETGERKYQFSVLDPFTEKYHFSVFPTKESKKSFPAFLKAEKYFGFEITPCKLIMAARLVVNSTAGWPRRIFPITLFLKSLRGGMLRSKASIEPSTMSTTGIL